MSNVDSEHASTSSREIAELQIFTGPLYNDTKILDILTSPNELLCRIKKDNTIVYVSVEPADLIPKQALRDFEAILRRLILCEPWALKWSTLSIDGRGEKIEYTVNDLILHSLDLAGLRYEYAELDLMDIEIVRKYKPRVWEAKLNGRFVVLKIARFVNEVDKMSNEIRIIDELRGENLVPAIVAVVFEGTPDRVVGALFEKIEGDFPSASDLGPCARQLKNLHVFARHGSITKYNIIMSSRGVRFVDLEYAELRLPHEPHEEFEEKLKAEMQQLSAELEECAYLDDPHGY